LRFNWKNSKALSLSLALISILHLNLSASAAETRAAQPKRLSPVMTLDQLGLKQYKLSNGLELILLKRPLAPVVAVNMIYHVGSRNEAVGYTGSTHFLEHMMFKGTAKFDPQRSSGIDDVLKKVGGINNATTSYDRTNYYEVAPKDSLELCLSIESDRMKNLLLRESDRQAEMTVVRNELERGEDEPGSLLETLTFATAFREHPYHHPVIGWRSDVEGVPTNRLRQFYRDFYYPDNATLVIAGDFNETSTLDLVQRYFGGITKRQSAYPPVYTTEPKQEGERRFKVIRGKDLPRVILAYHTPKGVDSATYDMDVIAKILGGSNKSTRLYKALIEPGLATECSAFNYTLLDPGLFIVTATLQPGVNQKDVEEKIKSELKKITEEPIEAKEFDLAKNSLAKRFRLSLSDPMNLCQSITEGLAVGELKFWTDYPDQILKVKEDKARACAKKILVEDNATIGYYQPRPEDSAPEASIGDADYRQADQDKKNDKTEIQQNIETERPVPPERKGPAKALKPSAQTLKTILPKPKISNIAKHVERFKLANGMTFLLYPNRDDQQKRHGTVAVEIKIKAGDYFAPKDKVAVADMTASMINFGTKTYDKTTLADNAENLGVSLDYSNGTFFQSTEAEVVSQDLDQLLGLIASQLSEPDFKQEDLLLVKKLSESTCLEKMADTAEREWNALLNKTYKPGTAYYADAFEKQIEQIKSIQLQDIKDYHARHYLAPNMVMAVVGDFDSGSLKPLLAKHFGSLQSGTAQEIKIDSSVLNKDFVDANKGKQIRVVMPDKANIDVSIAKPVDLSFKSHDYLAALIANSVLGFDSFACRLAPVRDRYGLTYSIASRISEPQYPFSPWSIDFSVNPANLERALEITKGISNEFYAKGITQQELDNEKSHLAGTFTVGLRNLKAIGKKLTEYEQIGMSLENIDDFALRISRVTLDEVNAAIKKHYDIKQAVTSMGGTFK
jgi:zinc protease